MVTVDCGSGREAAGNGNGVGDGYGSDIEQKKEGTRGDLVTGVWTWKEET